MYPAPHIILNTRKLALDSLHGNINCLSMYTRSFMNCYIVFLTRARFFFSTNLFVLCSQHSSVGAEVNFIIQS